ncbi:putative F-box domain, leucine-rich repeat domain, L domain-containing protein [Rosa chinensis]|uniref:Putative F-box domain, leucine-rich repeat domain, L domain-containing protein n=1 Tax=Rosa chinensis TaxID=74649 RepID=A0A2P6Q0V4_ROSCH|nr:F-box protein At1g47056 [Rosa chinensis]PRQ27769.1 putative F-box domain, leucine-rich repeat domain, L domain-containing protein [Rosa chinensis]
MGQSASAAAIPSRRENNHRHRSKSKATALISPMLAADESDEVVESVTDYISDLPDECLACIFQSLGSGDRKRCSLVCRRWLTVEGQSRHRLSLNAHADLQPAILSLFSRFDAVTKLALKCDRRAISIGDEALDLISLRCQNLTRLKLRACRELTDAGMLAFAKNCKALKKLSCGSCTFGAKGMNAVLENCSALEELSVKRLRGIGPEGSAVEPIGPGVAASSLKTICLKELYNGQCFGPLIIGAKNLRTLKLFRCGGDWDKLLQVIAERVTSMVEIHLEKLQVSDVALAAISNCLDLEILHLVKTPDCTNVGLISVSERCKLLRKLHIDGWKSNRVGDEGLISVAKSCPNLQELVLIGVNPTKASLETLAANCPNLERLALCGSDTVGDPELLCIAAKCGALKKLCIKSCPVSDVGLEGLASGCPNMVKVKVKKCRLVTPEGADSLRAKRPTLAVNLDTGEPPQDASASDGGAQDNPAVEFLPLATQPAFPDIASSSTGRSASFKSRLSLLSGRTLVACTLRRWVSRNS